MSETILELDIDSLAAGGDAVGRDAGGRVTFVPGAAPGDRVRARIVEERRGFARAELVEVVRPAPLRAEPPCPLFRAGTCGGCQWQHVEVAAQARSKAEICAAALRHRIEAGMELRPILTPAPSYGWRRRARLHWIRRRRSEDALLGFFAPRSRRITDVPVCPQLDPRLEQVLTAVRERLSRSLHGRGELEMLLGHRGEVQLALSGPCVPAAVHQLVDDGVVAGVRIGKRHHGAETIELEPGLPGRADHFAQASEAGNQALLEIVGEALAPLDGTRVLELHAGSGNFTRLLGAAARVVAVEGHRPPWPLPGDHVELHCGDVERLVPVLDAAGERFERCLLDPPRAGARGLIAPLLALAPERIVYVSCDPATLGRDLDALAEGGYQADWAQPVDLMPQTAQVEVVAVLSRRSTA